MANLFLDQRLRFSISESGTQEIFFLWLTHVFCPGLFISALNSIRVVLLHRHKPIVGRGKTMPHNVKLPGILGNSGDCVLIKPQAKGQQWKHWACAQERQSWRNAAACHCPPDPLPGCGPPWQSQLPPPPRPGRLPPAPPGLRFVPRRWRGSCKKSLHRYAPQDLRGAFNQWADSQALGKQVFFWRVHQIVN